MVLAPLKMTELEGQYDLRVRVHGGGPSGQAGAVRHGIARALVEVNPDFRVLLKRQGYLTRDARQVERKKAGLHKARKAPQFQQALRLRGRPRRPADLPASRLRPMARRYFGTDGVRGVVGEFLTVGARRAARPRGDALERRAARLRRARHARLRAPSSRQAFARGVVSAGGTAVLGGVLPTPAVALAALDLGVVISASHNPPEYNGVKFFDARGRKLTDAAEEEIEALLDAPPAPSGRGRSSTTGRRRRYLEHVLAHFGSDLAGLRIAVDCANGAYSGARAARVRAARRRRCTRSANEPDGTNINVGCGATDTARPAGARRAPAASTSGSRSTATATACSRSTSAASSSTATGSSRSSRSTSASTSSRSRR